MGCWTSEWGSARLDMDPWSDAQVGAFAWPRSMIHAHATFAAGGPFESPSHPICWHVPRLPTLRYNT